ncbi:hypothetical protein PPUJ20028_10570 [Pseudomonas putida]|uniref:Uncharacterized protein n=1 Tax=Pseudomonas putida TaxID=303 RepID=A0AA37R6X5_PSEPU|nr:hypothetical protein [Pseudomonas putida]GLO12476.1 hypothetical protein PPUJ20028_10570 [Pseudomonas putida]GLO35142.1 hypothetical protein PPUN14671_19750 [Pseudomonas putida]HDS0966363.1 hypothetical protein [Pseudomonas putida]HDS0992651.1 hypothetical protein [Pseudomonas putida]
MADDNLYEVWGDTVDSRHLLAAIAIGAACSLGTFFLAEHLLTGWVESSQMARAYAMLLGILGSLLGGGVSACLFTPKRHVVEHVADPAWRQQVIEELRSEYGGIGQLSDLPQEVRNELRELGLERLFDEAEPASPAVACTSTAPLKRGTA